jgi:hypothetical protein
MSLILLLISNIRKLIKFDIKVPVIHILLHYHYQFF